VFEARRYWYLSMDADDQDQSPDGQELIESERSVRTVTY
jgi:hypothetical protein